MNDTNAKEKIRAAYETISSVNKEAYKDVFLISNHVLGKNPYNNSFLDDLLSGVTPNPLGPVTIARKIAVYYAKSLLHFLLYLSRFMEFILSGFRFRLLAKDQEVVLVDTFFPAERILSAGAFEDYLLPGIAEALKKKGKYYAYLPFFCSTSYNKKPFELFRVLKVMKKNDLPAVTEYQLLSVWDMAYLLYFIAAYPFRVLGLAKRLKIGTPEARLLAHELEDSLDQVVFHNFSRYLVGRKVARLPCERIKVVSWYENQPIHKNLYKGLREGSGKVSIYGAQLFLFSQKYLSLMPDENEEAFGVIPDVIIVNGPGYIPRKTRLKYTVGPSLRYAKIFASLAEKEERRDIVVLLPNFMEDARNVLRILNGVKRFPGKVLIKSHPAIPIDSIKHLIPQDMTVTSKDVYELFKSAKVVIGASSGTLLEAAALGVGVIAIRPQWSMDYANPLPEYGRGLIWEEAATPEELSMWIEHFEQGLEKDRAKLSEIAREYRDMFFCEVNEENICRAFELKA